MFIGLFFFALYLYFFVGFDQIVLVANGVNSGQYVFFYSLAISSIVIQLWSAICFGLRLGEER